MLRNLVNFIQGAALALCCIFILPQSVAAEPPAGMSAEQVADLEQRVRERWQTLIAKDFGQTWEFSTPNYRRNFPKQLFVRNFSYAVDWQLTGIDVVNYDADAAVASVAVRVMSESAKQTASAASWLGPVPVTIHEKWLFTDGEWWHSANN